MTELILLISPMALGPGYRPRLSAPHSGCRYSQYVEREVILCVDAAAAVGDIATASCTLFPLITLPL